jgi:RNA recognition motif-containing protein
MSSQPIPTLYINNLNDKINKEELRTQLYALFTTYGKVVDVIASKGPKMRGQAFLVFTDLASATTAMRACEGMVFYDKPMVRFNSLLRENKFHFMYVAHHLREVEVICYLTKRRP